MFRLLKEQLQLILTVLVYCDRVGGYRPQSVATDATGHFRFYDPTIHTEVGDDKLTAVLGQMRNSGFRYDPMAYRDLTRHIATVLHAGIDTSADRNLIDLIAGVVKSASAKNVLRGGAIEELRKTLMFPNELSALKAAIGQLGCPGCGHQFENEEMVTLYRDDHRDTPGFYCSKCIKPMNACCDKCDATVNLRKDAERHRAILAPSLCAEHLGPPPKKKKEDVGVDPRPGLPTDLEDAFRGHFIVPTRPTWAPTRLEPAQPDEENNAVPQAATRFTGREPTWEMTTTATANPFDEERDLLVVPPTPRRQR